MQPPQPGFYSGRGFWSNAPFVSFVGSPIQVIAIFRPAQLPSVNRPPLPCAASTAFLLR